MRGMPKTHDNAASTVSTEIVGTTRGCPGKGLSLSGTLHAAIVVVLLLAGGLELRAADEEDQPWIKLLKPGFTRTDVHALLGKPDGAFRANPHSNDPYEYYRRNRLYFFCYESEGAAAELVYGGSCELEDFENPLANSRRYFIRFGSERDQELQDYLHHGDLAVTPRFERQIGYIAVGFIGTWYPTKDGYVSITRFLGDTKPLLPYANTNSEVIFIAPDGSTRTLYSLSDHWESFRPAHVPEAAVLEREQRLRSLGLQKIGQKWDAFLGPSDGILVRNGPTDHLYYFRHGVIVVTVSNDEIECITIETFEGSGIELQDWLSESRAAGRHGRLAARGQVNMERTDRDKDRSVAEVEQLNVALEVGQTTGAELS